jgi:hypothetical protein
MCNGKEFEGTSLKLHVYLKLLLYIGALLILLRRYGIKITHGAPRTPYVQGLVEQANGTVENKIRAWKMDHGTSKWEPSLVDIAWALNHTYVESIGCTPWELVFRNNMCPLHQLDVNERKEILGVPCEEGGFLTEASLQEGNPIEPTEEVTDRFTALDRKRYCSTNYTGNFE